MSQESGVGEIQQATHVFVTIANSFEYIHIEGPSDHFGGPREQAVSQMTRLVLGFAVGIDRLEHVDSEMTVYSTKSLPRLPKGLSLGASFLCTRRPGTSIVYEWQMQE